MNDIEIFFVVEIGVEVIGRSVLVIFVIEGIGEDIGVGGCVFFCGLVVVDVDMYFGFGLLDLLLVVKGGCFWLFCDVLGLFVLVFLFVLSSFNLCKVILVVFFFVCFLLLNLVLLVKVCFKMVRLVMKIGL